MTTTPARSFSSAPTRAVANVRLAAMLVLVLAGSMHQNHANAFSIDVAIDAQIRGDNSNNLHQGSVAYRHAPLSSADPTRLTAVKEGLAHAVTSRPQPSSSALPDPWAHPQALSTEPSFADLHPKQPPANEFVQEVHTTEEAVEPTPFATQISFQPTADDDQQPLLRTKSFPLRRLQLVDLGQLADLGPLLEATEAPSIAVDNTAGGGKPGTPCTDTCSNTKEGIALFCVTDDYLATDSDGSKFCSCQNRNFRITKGEPDYDTAVFDADLAQAKAAFEAAGCTARARARRDASDLAFTEAETGHADGAADLAVEARDITTAVTENEVGKDRPAQPHDDDQQRLLRTKSLPLRRLQLVDIGGLNDLLEEAEAAASEAACIMACETEANCELQCTCETLQTAVDAAEAAAAALLAGPDRRKETNTVVITLSVILFLFLIYIAGLVCGEHDFNFDLASRTRDSLLGDIAVFSHMCSFVIGILGLSFARYGLLKASSITTYSPAHGCLPYNNIDAAATSSASEEETPDASADFEYGYADGWSGSGTYWFIVHLCTPGIATVFVSVIHRCRAWPINNITTYGSVAIVFALEMSAIIVVGARAQGHSSLIGYGVFFMIGVSLALSFPAVLHYFYMNYSGGNNDFRSERGAASKVGLFVAATLSLFAVIGIALTTTPEYISTVTGTGTGEAGEAGLELALQAELLQTTNKENESKALTTFAIIGSIVTAGLLAHYGTHPLTRDYELYLLVWGGLLDATTDVLYMMMEVFYDEAIFSACASIILLPLVMVALSFWPLMAYEYKTQKWRYILLPLEGALLLLVLPFISTANIVPAFASDVFFRGYHIAEAIYNKMYVEITEKETERRGDDGRQRHFKKKLKFYHRGVFEALLAFVFAPVAILIIVAVGLAITAVGTSIMFAFVLAGPMAIAVVFSIMAFLRLFVLFPTVWEELYYFACWFARMARERVPVDGFMDDDRLDKAKGQVFKLYDASSAKDAKSDMKDSTIKYLFVEFLLEALPQLIIQGINNNQTDNWSNISIISMSISGIIILNSVIKYGSLYCLVDEEEVFGGF
eukprot:gene8476-35205_t